VGKKKKKKKKKVGKREVIRPTEVPYLRGREHGDEKLRHGRRGSGKLMK